MDCLLVYKTSLNKYQVMSSLLKSSAMNPIRLHSFGSASEMLRTSHQGSVDARYERTQINSPHPDRGLPVPILLPLFQPISFGSVRTLFVWFGIAP